MAQTLEELVVAIGADTKKFDSVISKSKKVFGGFTKAIGVGVVAAGAVAGASFAISKKIAATSDNVDKMSQKIGVSREAYQEWDFILSQFGTSVDGLQPGMKSLSNAAYEASIGTKLYADAFKELKIDVENADGTLKNQEELLKETIVALQGMDDTTKRTALASKLLGRSATELAPLLNAGAGAAEDLTKKAHELGIVLDDETIDAGVVFTDTMDQLKRSMGAVGISIFGGLVPAFTNMAQWVLDNMPMIRSKFEVVFGVIKNVVTTAIDVFEQYALPVFRKVWNYIQDHWPAMKNTFEEVFIKIGLLAFDVYTFFQKNLQPIFESIFDFIKDNWPTMKEIFVEVFERIISTATDAYNFFENSLLPVLALIFQMIKENWPILGDTFVNAFQAIWDIVNTVWDILDATLFPVLEKIFGYIQDNWPIIEGTFVDTFTVIDEVINTVIDSIESLVGWLKDAVDWFGKFFTEKKDLKGEGVGGGALGMTGLDLKAKALGGPVTKGRPYITSENGPEMFVPNENGNIINSQASNRMMGESGQPTDIKIVNNFYTEQNPAAVVRKQKQTLVQEAKVWGLR